jgi:hypothetical protein
MWLLLLHRGLYSLLVMEQGEVGMKRSLYVQMRIMPFSQFDLPSFMTLLTVKTNQKNAISRHRGCNDNK